jgi:hypothetical protein
LPIKNIVRDEFRNLLYKYNLQAYIIEKTPFNDEKYAQITERIPLNVFIEEKGLNID